MGSGEENSILDRGSSLERSMQIRKCKVDFGLISGMLWLKHKV